MDNANTGATKVFGLKGFNFTNPPIITGGNTSFVPIAAFTHSTANEGKETDHYFFHPDHLGSSNYITNFVGEVSQHMEYFAFGETFIEEHKNSHNSPYKFNGKELDEESGLYYYGARYYDPRISIWASVDPLAEKFPNFSPYAYCYQNPINFIDPTGMEGEESGGDPPSGCWYRKQDGNNLQYSYFTTSQVPEGFTKINSERVVHGKNGDSSFTLNGDGTFKVTTSDNQAVYGSVEWNMQLKNGGTFSLKAGGNYKHYQEKGTGMGMVDAIPLFLTGLAIERVAGGFLARVFSGLLARGGFNAAKYADEIVALNKATDGGGALLNGTPASAINTAMYYETSALQGASIFRSISGGHMFINGNKRTAVAAFQSWAKQHGLKTVGNEQMMNVATQVATGVINDVSQIAKMLIK